MAQIIVEKQEVIDKALDVEAVRDNTPFVQVLDVIPPPPPEHTPGTIERVFVTTGALEKQYQDAPARNPITANKIFTDEQEQAVLAGLRQLSAMCDGAEAIDGHGFNKRDTIFGKSLAGQSKLSNKQFAAGQKMIRLYHRQLSPDLLRSAGIEPKEKKA
jgi:hypothetical protein